ncbi:hypothetical protein EDD21DRAFT_114440 [Dissophora ornata]|nr:hypothetical protein EDD21DRAFT_114440 [Dissophora ornata]
MPQKKKKTSQTKTKGGVGHPSRHVSKSDYTANEAIVDQVIAGSEKTAEFAGIATLEESILSGAIEASLQSAQEDADLQQYLTQDDDILFAAINEAQFGGGTEECSHVKDVVKPAQFRRLIAKHKDWDHCQGCLNDHARIKKLAQTLDTALAALALADMSGDPTEGLPADSLWMCLSCCEINCGRALKKHAIVHHDKTRKDHPLAINLASLDCWCYECDDQLATSKNKNPAAQEYQSLLSKLLQARQSKAREVSVALAKKSKGAAPAAAKTRIFTPGLQNLGNTCFFNSVMQVLTETRSLKVILGDKNQSELPTSLSAITEKGLGPLTTTFKDFLFTMWKQQGGIVTPRDLFMQIAKKWKVFRGFREQDSQELMRHLFDGIRLEEVDLIKKKVAGESASSSSELDATSSHDESPKYVPFIDSCFSGKLASVIVCQSCKKVRPAMHETFQTANVYALRLNG